MCPTLKFVKSVGFLFVCLFVCLVLLVELTTAAGYAVYWNVYKQQRAWFFIIRAILDPLADEDDDENDLFASKPKVKVVQEPKPEVTCFSFLE